MGKEDALFKKFGKTFNPGDIIFCEYEPGNEMYIIVEGKVLITKIIKDKEATLVTLGEGDIFGEMAIIENRPRTATAIALDGVKALAFNKEMYQPVIRNTPALAIKLIRKFSNSIVNAQRKIQNLSINDLPVRLADALLRLSRGGGPINKTTEDVASEVGLTVKECEPVLIQLEKEGKIKRKETELEVTKPDDLERMVLNYRKKEAFKHSMSGS